jgi:hypothetical protein
MDNTDFELVWRKKMVTALATCVLRDAWRQHVRIAPQDRAPGALTKGNHEDTKKHEGHEGDVVSSWFLCDPVSKESGRIPRTSNMRAFLATAVAIATLSGGPAASAQPALDDLIDRAGGRPQHESAFWLLAMDEETCSGSSGRPIPEATCPATTRRRHGGRSPGEPPCREGRLRARPGRLVVAGSVRGR